MAHYISTLTGFRLLSMMLMLALCACDKHNSPIDEEDPDLRKPAAFQIEWPEGVIPPKAGMRVNLFALNNSPVSGIDDLSSTGGNIRLVPGSSYMAVCYDYFGPENIRVRNENDPDLIEAYTIPVVRATYSKANPEETTVSEPDDFYMVRVPEFTFTGEGSVPLVFRPVNVTRSYSYEIRNVKGTENIVDMRSAVSGMSSSFFMGRCKASDEPATLMASGHAANGTISGSFRSFGACPGEPHILTVEILTPSVEGGILRVSWDVTEVIEAQEQQSGENPGEETPVVVVIDAKDEIDIPAPPPNPDTSGAFQVSIGTWNDVYIPISI